MKTTNNQSKAIIIKLLNGVSLVALSLTTILISGPHFTSRYKDKFNPTQDSKSGKIIQGIDDFYNEGIIGHPIKQLSNYIIYKNKEGIKPLKEYELENIENIEESNKWPIVIENEHYNKSDILKLLLHRAIKITDDKYKDRYLEASIEVFHAQKELEEAQEELHEFEDMKEKNYGRLSDIERIKDKTEEYFGEDGIQSKEMREREDKAKSYMDAINGYAIKLNIVIDFYETNLRKAKKKLTEAEKELDKAIIEEFIKTQEEYNKDMQQESNRKDEESIHNSISLSKELVKGMGKDANGLKDKDKDKYIKSPAPGN